MISRATDWVVPLDHIWELKVDEKSMPQETTDIVNEDDQKTTAEKPGESSKFEYELNYDIYNEGPSLSETTTVYVFFPQSPDLLNLKTVTVDGIKCPFGTNMKMLVPPVMDEDVTSEEKAQTKVHTIFVFFIHTFDVLVFAL